MLTSSRLVEVAHDLDADHDHGDGKSNEATRWTEEWPVAGEVALEYRQLRCDEKYYHSQRTFELSGWMYLQLEMSVMTWLRASKKNR